MSLEELLDQNLPARVKQIEDLYRRETIAVTKLENYISVIKSYDEKFLEIEASLLKRMSLIEEFIKNIAELSYKGGFYEPDKSGEQKIISKLKTEIEEKDKRIKEFENTLKKLMGK